MVFVRKVPTASGATAVQIAERIGDRDNVIEHVGSAHTEAELVALLEVARARLHPGQGELDLSLPAGPVGHGVITGKRCALLWQVLTGGYRELGFDAVGDDAFKQLVLARIIEPTSKADCVRVLDELGVEHASLRTMFRYVQRAAMTGGYRDTIAAACYAHAAPPLADLSLVLYDVTTLYFEAENEDDLRKVGYSKERRVDPQIVVGLLVDRAGFPLEIGCFEGNKAETTTIVPIMKAFAERHHGRRHGRGRRRRDAVGGEPDRARRGEAAVHRRVAGDQGADRPGVALPLARRRVHRRAGHRHRHPDAPRAATTARTTRRCAPNRSGTPTSTPGPGGRCGPYSAKRAARDSKTLTAQENRARAVVAGEKAARTPRFVKTSNGVHQPGRGRARPRPPLGRA